MFKVILKYHKMKYTIKEYVIAQLRGNKTLNKEVYERVILHFFNDKETTFILDMRCGNVWNDDLESIIQERRGDWTKVNAVDLHHLFFDLFDYLKLKFILCRDLNVEIVEKDDNYSININYRKKMVDEETLS